MTDKAKGCGFLLLYIAMVVLAFLKGLDHVTDGYDLLAHEDDVADAISQMGHGTGLLCLSAAMVMSLISLCTLSKWALFLFGFLVVVALLCILAGVVADVAF